MDYVLNQSADVQIAHTHYDVIAVIDRDQDALCGTLPPCGA